MKDDLLLDALAKSLSKVGQLHPALLDQHGNVIDGKLLIAACARVGLTPWTVTVPHDPEVVRREVMIRRQLGPMQIAMLAGQLASEESPQGARRAPGQGRLQHAVAKRLAEDYAVEQSPRATAQALTIAKLGDDERNMLEQAAPASLREAQRVIAESRTSCGDTEKNDGGSRTELVKQMNELRAVLRRAPAGPLCPADRALAQDVIKDLRAALGEAES